MYYGPYKLKPDEIGDLLSKVSEDDLKVLGIDPKASRPEWLILSTLLVPPVMPSSLFVIMTSPSLGEKI